MKQDPDKTAKISNEIVLLPPCLDNVAVTDENTEECHSPVTAGLSAWPVREWQVETGECLLCIVGCHQWPLLHQGAKCIWQDPKEESQSYGFSHALAAIMKEESKVLQFYSSAYWHADLFDLWRIQACAHFELYKSMKTGQIFIHKFRLLKKNAVSILSHKSHSWLLQVNK